MLQLKGLAISEYSSDMLREKKLALAKIRAQHLDSWVTTDAYCCSVCAHTHVKFLIQLKDNTFMRLCEICMATLGKLEKNHDNDITSHITAINQYRNKSIQLCAETISLGGVMSLCKHSTTAYRCATCYNQATHDIAWNDGWIKLCNDCKLRTDLLVPGIIKRIVLVRCVFSIVVNDQLLIWDLIPTICSHVAVLGFGDL